MKERERGSKWVRERERKIIWEHSGKERQNEREREVGTIGRKLEFEYTEGGGQLVIVKDNH